MEAVGSGRGGFKRTYKLVEKLLMMQLIKIQKGIKEQDIDTRLCRISLREQNIHGETTPADF